MAETLRSVTEALSNLPDNTSQLISPQDAREAHLSLLPDRGSCYWVEPGGGTFAVPIPASGTWVDIISALDTGGETVLAGESLFWRQDAPGRLIYDYVADWPTTIVPAGYTRSVDLLAAITFDPQGDTWEFAVSIGGVIQAPTSIVETANQTDAITVPIISGDPIDVSVAPPVSIACRNLDDATDLPLYLFGLRARGGPLA